MAMTQFEAVAFLKKEHSGLRRTIKRMSILQRREKILGHWTVEQILGHISAWNIEEITAMSTILKGKKPWFCGVIEDQFNEAEAGKRSDWTFEHLFDEWEKTFTDLCDNISNLTDEEWNYENGHVWDDGIPLTIRSMFDYEYNGAGHEAGHAKQIREYFAKAQ